MAAKKKKRLDAGDRAIKQFEAGLLAIKCTVGKVDIKVDEMIDVLEAFDVLRYLLAPLAQSVLDYYEEHIVTDRSGSSNEQWDRFVRYAAHELARDEVDPKWVGLNLIQKLIRSLFDAYIEPSDNDDYVDLEYIRLCHLAARSMGE